MIEIFRIRNWNLSTKSIKGRVVLRGDIVTDDSGAYAVFTEQRPSASQMTSAKVMDIISRLPRCSGQAADAVSAYTQVKMEDVQIFGYVPVVPLERNLYGHPLAGLLRQFEKVLLEHGWGKVPNCECLFVNRAKGLFLSVYVDDIRLASKT